MLLGLDIGGTHTDVVAIGKDGIAASAKVVTNHDDLLASVTDALERVFSAIDVAAVDRINLSTTLSTNAIVERTTEEVGVIVSAGPGVDPQAHAVGNRYYAIAGSIDHRGTEVLPPAEGEIQKAVRHCLKNGVKVFAAVSKFSTRNPAHENRIRDIIQGNADFTTVGHELSGALNFPRRVSTAYFNSAVWRIFNRFADAIESGVAAHGIAPAINILKADGGTMPLAVARRIPVESILSGPAASVMGIVALCDIVEDAVVLDIGGTTTDIAIFADGAPLVEDGIELDERATLVRALKTRSIGIGGDSILAVSGTSVTAGPERRGPSMADGGSAPTLIDAFNVKKLAAYGDTAASEKGVRALAKKSGRSPEDLAGAAIDYAMRAIKEASDAMVRTINEKPVYTVHEVLEGKTIVPKRLYVMGGPARAFSDALAKRFGLPITVPEQYAVANAVGAALTRATMDIELFADTERGVMLIPFLNVNERVSGSYTLEHAKKDAQARLADHLAGLGVKPAECASEIIEAASFNMVGGWSTTGRNIRVKCQVKPGIVKGYRVG